MTANQRIAAAQKRVSKMRAYQDLSAHGGTRWIANVFLTNSGTASRRECTRAMIRMAEYQAAGHEFAPASFTMPTDSFLMDGRPVKFTDFIKPDFEPVADDDWTGECRDCGAEVGPGDTHCQECIDLNCCEH